MSRLPVLADQRQKTIFLNIDRRGCHTQSVNSQPQVWTSRPFGDSGQRQGFLDILVNLQDDDVLLVDRANSYVLNGDPGNLLSGHADIADASRGQRNDITIWTDETPEGNCSAKPKKKAPK
jgi:hypothetical protein